MSSVTNGKRKRWYAVRCGTQPGVYYTTFDQVQGYVFHVKGSKFAGFDTEKDAQHYMTLGPSLTLESSRPAEQYEQELATTETMTPEQLREYTQSVSLAPAEFLGKHYLKMLNAVSVLPDADTTLYMYCDGSHLRTPNAQYDHHGCAAVIPQFDMVRTVCISNHQSPDPILRRPPESGWTNPRNELAGMFYGLTLIQARHCDVTRAGEHWAYNRVCVKTDSTFCQTAVQSACAIAASATGGAPAVEANSANRHMVDAVRLIISDLQKHAVLVSVEHVKAHRTGTDVDVVFNNVADYFAKLANVSRKDYALGLSPSTSEQAMQAISMLPKKTRARKADNPAPAHPEEHAQEKDDSKVVVKRARKSKKEVLEGEKKI
jgi:hypothetical protein